MLGSKSMLSARGTQRSPVGRGEDWEDRDDVLLVGDVEVGEKKHSSRWCCSGRPSCAVKRGLLATSVQKQQDALRYRTGNGLPSSDKACSCVTCSQKSVATCELVLEASADSAVSSRVKMDLVAGLAAGDGDAAHRNRKDGTQRPPSRYAGRRKLYGLAR